VLGHRRIREGHGVGLVAMLAGCTKEMVWALVCCPGVGKLGCGVAMGTLE
jgi:hypothetical protein